MTRRRLPAVSAKNLFRVLVLVLLVSLSATIVGFGSGGTSTDTERDAHSTLAMSELDDATNATVVTAYGGPLSVYDGEGDLLYRNSSYHSYWDVDPVPGTKATFAYSATDVLNRSECHATTKCVRNVIEELNLSTGETRVVHTRIRRGTINNEWHDVDRLNDTHYVVADIKRNSVYVINSETGVAEWMWNAQSDFELSSGGSLAFGTKFPEDWTHLNDVEVLDDGRIMVSLRNQDAIVFVDRQEGFQENWTLGSNDDYETMYEQHNPDYIPEERGGPAVVLADSQNNRIVEYQREDGRWEQSWVWSDESMYWPRDVDRLPDGTTLITDTNSHRVLQVDERGEKVWVLDYEGPGKIYEAERLGTGDESTGAPSARAADLQSRGSGDVGEEATHTNDGFSPQKLWAQGKEMLPPKLLNSIMFIKPAWLTSGDLVWLLLCVTLTALWVGVEYYWASFSIAVRSPVEIRR